MDDLLELVAAVTADVAIEETAKRRRWVRIFQLIGGVLFLGLIAGVVYITIKYS